MWWFKRKKSLAEEPSSIWKSDFSDCVTTDYLPSYSVCNNENNTTCRYVALYAGMSLCGNPQHKTFIPNDTAPTEPE